MPVVIMAVVMVSMVMIMCVTVVVIMRVAMREGVAVMMVIRISHALARFAGEAPLNTDDHPVVSYCAPRITYLPDSLPRDRLITLLRAVDIHPDELVGNDDTSLRDTDWTARLEAYWTAHNRYLEMGSAVQPTTDVRRMLATVREPLLSVLRVSPDSVPRMIRCCGWRSPSAESIRRLPARCCLSSSKCSPCARKRPGPCAISWAKPRDPGR